MHNQIHNVRYPEMPRQRKRPTIEEDIYTVILDVYDKMRYLIAINGVLAVLVVVLTLFILATN